MKHKKRTLYILLTVILIIIAAVVGIIVNNAHKLSLLDKSEYRTLSSEIEEAVDSGVFTSQEDLRNYITSWADSESLEYTVDKTDNIIFSFEATATKSKLAPTVVCVSYNYETIEDNENLIAAAAMIAKTDLNAGKYTVIFFNDENNSGIGYKSINKNYFSSNDKIIYLDYGKSSYISDSSFAMNKSTIAIPTETVDSSCDTAVKITISGLSSDEVITGVSKQSNTIVALSTLLTRLKTKSTICQLADFSIEDHGNMYPVTLEATILLNSYSVDSFTSYIDKQIKSWEKKYLEDNPDFTYTYEVIDDADEIPTKAYSDETLSNLTSVLYMLKNDSYKYESQDTIPDGREEGDTYGINCLTGLRLSSNGNICIDILSQGYNQTYLDRITNDNAAVAELFNCNYKIKSSEDAYLNEDSSVKRVIISTYSKVNDITSAATVLTTDMDNYFTPCSYLDDIEDGADIIHIRMNNSKTISLTNTILCYIVTKGNLFSF